MGGGKARQRKELGSGMNKGSAGHKKPPPGHTTPEGVSAHAPSGNNPTRRA
jgi:hypothetical protein